VELSGPNVTRAGVGNDNTKARDWEPVHARSKNEIHVMVRWEQVSPTRGFDWEEKRGEEAERHNAHSLIREEEHRYFRHKRGPRMAPQKTGGACSPHQDNSFPLWVDWRKLKAEVSCAPDDSEDGEASFGKAKQIFSTWSDFFEEYGYKPTTALVEEIFPGKETTIIGVSASDMSPTPVVLQQTSPMMRRIPSSEQNEKATFSKYRESYRRLRAEQRKIEERKGKSEQEVRIEQQLEEAERKMIANCVLPHLEKHTVALIVGKTGSGKSTFTRLMHGEDQQVVNCAGEGEAAKWGVFRICPNEDCGLPIREE
jgi:hypothetical protein